MKTLKVLKYIGFGILGVAFVFAAVFVTMSLWNWLVPELFNGPTLTFWQTAGLFILSKILLSGVSPGRHDCKSPKNEFQGKFHEKFKEKFEEKFKEKCEEHCREKEAQEKGVQEI
jgi:hypothetical protein